MEEYEKLDLPPMPDELKAILDMVQPVGKNFEPVARAENVKHFLEPTTARQAHLATHNESIDAEELLQKCSQKVKDCWTQYKSQAKTYRPHLKLEFTRMLGEFYQWSKTASAAASVCECKPRPSAEERKKTAEAEQIRFETITKMFEDWDPKGKEALDYATSTCYEEFEKDCRHEDKGYFQMYKKPKLGDEVPERNSGSQKGCEPDPEDSAR